MSGISGPEKSWLMKGNLTGELSCDVLCDNLSLKGGVDGSAKLWFHRFPDGEVSLNIQTEKKHLKLIIRDQESQSKIAALMLGHDKYAELGAQPDSYHKVVL